MNVTSLDEYQKLSERTSGFRGYTFDSDEGEKRLCVASLGIAGEAGEVIEHVKKVVGHGHALDLTKVSKELGDLLYYVAEVASCLGLSLSDIASENVEKLKERYPQGFSSAASINRSV